MPPSASQTNTQGHAKYQTRTWPPIQLVLREENRFSAATRRFGSIEAAFLLRTGVCAPEQAA